MSEQQAFWFVVGLIILMLVMAMMGAKGISAQ
jgi:hypothetical protein